MRKDTIPHLFLDKVEKFGQRIALREKEFGIWQEITWEGYLRHVKHFCLGLMAFGLEKGGHVSILGENVPEWLYSDLAAQSAGGVGIGIYPTSPAPEVKYVLGHSESTFVVCGDQEQVDKVLEVRNELPLLTKIIAIDMKGLRNYTDPMLVSFEKVEAIGADIDQKDPDKFYQSVNQLTTEDVAIMVYTSGTTGPPKGAMISHECVLNMIPALMKVIPQDETDEIVSYLPLCHVAERMMSVCLPMYSGATANFAESIDTVVIDMREILPTFYFAVPRIWEKMMASLVIKMKDASWLKQRVYHFFLPRSLRMTEAMLAGKSPSLSDKVMYGIGYLALFRHLKKELGLLRAKFALSGAAAISPEVLKFFYSIGIPVLEGWGMTEETGLATVTLPGRHKLGTVGPPLSGVEIRLAEDGEILLRCSHIFLGYWRDPEATAKAIQDGWLHTGDVGELDEDGILKITDRKKEIIITSGGKNIAPSEIENRLKCSPYINEAIVIGDGRKYLTSLIQIEYDNVAKWAQERNLAYTTFKSLAQLKDVVELVQSEVNDANRDFAQVETIKKFRLLEKELDHDDGEVTATLKLRRKMVNKKFGSLIDQMYPNK